MVCVQDTDQTELEFELQNALLTYPHWRLKGSFNMPQNAVWRDSSDHRFFEEICCA
jgi:hypothetical protein